MIFGLMVVIAWYLNGPVLVPVSVDQVPYQLDIMLGILLIVMGLFLALMGSVVLNTWRIAESLQKNLDGENYRRKKVETWLERSQEMSNTGNWTMDISGQEIQWSNEVFRILGCSPLNKSVSFAKFLESVHPDDRYFVEKAIERSLTQGKAFNLTHRIVPQEGSTKIVKQRSEIYLDQKGKPAQILGIIQDITDQKESENLADRLGRILDKSFNEVYIFDADTLLFTRANLAARLNLRYSMEELSEMTPMDLFPEQTWKEFEKLISSLKKGIESTVVFESVHRRKNDTHYPVDIRLQLSRTETHPQLVAIVQDVTYRKKYEELIQQK